VSPAPRATETHARVYRPAPRWGNARAAGTIHWPRFTSHVKTRLEEGAGHAPLHGGIDRATRHLRPAHGAHAVSRPVRPLKVQPLWARVDQNRAKLAAFVVLFVVGSAVLVTAALVALPAALIGAFGAWYTGWWSPAGYVGGFITVTAIGFATLILGGTLLAAVQLGNAEDWVRNRFKGKDLPDKDAPTVAAALSDMMLAAGLSSKPRLMLLDTDEPSINAFALGTSRSKSVIGVTRGFLESLTPDEQRAVIATLSARIATGDIWFATALAALMGPLKAVREARPSGETMKAVGDGCGSTGGCGDVSGCGDGCGGCADLGDAGDLGKGCAGALVIVAFFILVALLTYIAVVCAAWIVTLWGRALHRTAYEKADAEGMLLLKDPEPMLSALRKVSESSTAVGSRDPSYDGVFYASTSGTPRVERVEARRFARLREVLGTDGIAAAPLVESPDDT
jgi:Zn-dependent protease with chaperone function